MHPASTRQAALDLMAQGLNDCQVARALGVPRRTVRDWRHFTPRHSLRPACPRCWRPAPALAFTSSDYAELLGLYLGDGHIAKLPRTQRLRISLDAKYPGIVDDAEALLRRCFPENRVCRVLADRGATVVLSVYNGHLACLFPQHGPGKKHLRPIVLEPWQSVHVEAEPWAFLRGCIRSDGSVFVNRTGRYEYLSYHFGNLSPGIRDLFARTCEQVGVVCRTSGRHVRINRRDSVALMLEHVGRKS
jgi:Homeodomain-like domain